MAIGQTQGVRIVGIASAVAKTRQDEAALAAAFDNEVARRLVLGTGVAERRIDSRFCASDYCEAAAKKLLADLGWDPLTISHLVFVSETPDYPLPATACILQFRLGISTDCTCFDVNLGCSGYTHGLWILARMLSPGQRGLLLVGDTLAKIVSPDDRSLVPLIGDGGSATALESVQHLVGVGTTMHFVGGTNGADFRSIIVNAGQCRFPASETTAIRKAGPDGVIRSEENLYMNGSEVFTFALREVAGLVHQTMELAGWQVSDVDDFVFHQANGFMLSNLANKLSIPSAKMPMSLDRYGNSGAPTIPITLTAARQTELATQSRRMILVGFGVGFSWGAVAIEVGPVCMPNMIELT